MQKEIERNHLRNVNVQYLLLFRKVHAMDRRHANSLGLDLVVNGHFLEDLLFFVVAQLGEIDLPYHESILRVFVVKIRVVSVQGCV